MGHVHSRLPTFAIGPPEAGLWSPVSMITQAYHSVPAWLAGLTGEACGRMRLGECSGALRVSWHRCLCSPPRWQVRHFIYAARRVWFERLAVATRQPMGRRSSSSESTTAAVLPSPKASIRTQRRTGARSMSMRPSQRWWQSRSRRRLLRSLQRQAELPWLAALPPNTVLHCSSGIARI